MQNLVSYDPRTETGLNELFRGFFKPVRLEGPRIGRNDPCHCGSGKKFKKCHGVGVD